MQLVTGRFLAINRVARRIENGVEYAVAPVVAVVAGVLNGEILPAEEIEKSVAKWEDIPLTVGHPRVNNEFVSIADAPADAVVGMFRNVRYLDERLVGEVWVDVAHAAAAEVVARIDRDEMVEVSTGYFAKITTNEDGIGVHSDLIPDHLALLPNEVGACSITDGCGTPRTNQQENPTMTVQNEAPTTPVVNNESPTVPAAPAVPDAPAVVTIELPEEVTAFAELLQEFGGVDEVRSLLQGLKTNADAQRDALVATIVANTSMTSEDLKDIPMPALAKLAANFAVPAKAEDNTANFFGYAPAVVAVQNSGGDWEEYTAPAAK